MFLVSEGPHRTGYPSPQIPDPNGSQHKESHMNKFVTALVGTYLVLTHPTPKRREAGQGSLEYVGAIAVAALIVAALGALAAGFGGQIGAIITAAINKVKALVG
jgi:hypothetical protein